MRQSLESVRNDGAYVLGVMAILLGIWHLGLVLKEIPSLKFLPQMEAATRNLEIFGRVAALIINPMFIIGGIFVLKRNAWGRHLMIAVSAVDIGKTFLMQYLWTKAISQSDYEYSFLYSPVLLILVVNIWFFTRKSTRQLFL